VLEYTIWVLSGTLRMIRNAGICLARVYQGRARLLFVPHQVYRMSPPRTRVLRAHRRISEPVQLAPLPPPHASFEFNVHCERNFPSRRTMEVNREDIDFTFILSFRIHIHLHMIFAALIIRDCLRYLMGMVGRLPPGTQPLSFPPYDKIVWVVLISLL